MTIFNHIWLYDHIQPYMTIWPYSTIYNYMTIFNHIWPYSTIYDYMTIFNLIWLYDHIQPYMTIWPYSTINVNAYLSSESLFAAAEVEISKLNRRRHNIDYLKTSHDILKSLLVHEENTNVRKFHEEITSVSCLDTMIKNIHKLNQLLPQPELQT